MAQAPSDGNGSRPWWQSAVIYQVYPRSFADSNADGIGDIPGIVSRLDYLAWLGVGAVWLSPIFRSPMADFGYDVSDYTAIEPMFGTLEDFDRLVAEAHARGLRILLDFVPNHTSEEHPWFVEARASRDNPRRDWYIWRDPRPDGSPPNNWLSNFGGPAWTFDEATGQYYYHAFLPQQPDLNWRNPDVRRAMADVLRFWLRRGVDGFRVDVIWHLIKDEQFTDNPLNPNFTAGMPPHQAFIQRYNTDRPEVHAVIAELRAVVDEFGGRLLIGEIYLPFERLVTYYGEAGGGVHLPFNFQLLQLPWEADRVGAAIDAYEAALPEFGWPNWVLGNHDRPRIATRVGRDQARVAAMLLLTLRGTPTLYYGDEIGMTSVAIPPERVQDPFELRVPGIGVGRDPVRTPMQWDASPHAGFSSAEPWLPVAPDYKDFNVEREKADARSMLALHRRLLDIRNDPALLWGAYERLPQENAHVLVYRRTYEGAGIVVALNFTEDRAPVVLPPGATVALSTHLDREAETAVDGRLTLRSHEGLVLREAP
jgi:alpha-glucosidase